MKNSNQDPVRLAVIGLGKMGLLHASILNVSKNVELVALCDKSPTMRKVLKKLLKNVLLAEDLTQLSSLNLDAVFVTTPIRTHFPIIKNLVANKIARNIFTEKTLASNHSEANELCELARDYQGTMMVGYMKRFGVTFKKVKSFLDERIIGDLVSFDAYAYSSDFAEMNGRSRKSGNGDGVLSDLGSHIVDMALWYFGNLEVESGKLTIASGLECEDAASFEVVGNSGNLNGHFGISWSMSEYRMPEFGMVIRGTDGTITANDDQVTLELKQKPIARWYRHDLNDSVGFLIGAAEYFREDEDFINSVLNHKPVDSDFKSASKVDYLLDQVKKKAEKQ